MNILVYDDNFNLVSQFEDFVSLIWCERYIDAGAIDLVVECNAENIALFKYGYFIVRPDTKSVCRIDNIEIQTNDDNDDELIIGATDLKTIAKNAIVGKSLAVEDRKYNAEQLLRDTFALFCPDEVSGYDEKLFPNFKSKFLKMKESHGFNAEVYDVTESDKEDYTALDLMTLYCQQSGLGWQITFEDGFLWFDVLESSKNETVVFSPEFDNIKETKYKKSGSKLVTVARVLHSYPELLNDNGFVLSYDSEKEPTGLDCIELIVDAKNQNPDGMSATEFKDYLFGLGLEKLRQKQITQSFECEVFTDLWKYKKDYNLGDYVKVTNKYGLTIDGQITEVVETWDDTGYSIEPKFEYNDLESENAVNAIATENGLYLTTENNLILVWEDIEYNVTLLGSTRLKKILADSNGNIIGTKTEVLENG